jgi:sigma-B regulation protein RsbU (phosphoserine phosphatase)
MSAAVTNRIRKIWPRMSRVDMAALAVLLVFGALWLARYFFPGTPQSSFLVFLVVLALGYFAIRGFLWARAHLLWSLRNRLVIAYIFIAVVPVLLLLTMAGLSAYLLYWQLGSFVLYTDVHERVERVSSVAGTMATAIALEAEGRRAVALALPEGPSTYLKAAQTELPGLKIEPGVGQQFLHGKDGGNQQSFAGLVLSGNELTLRAVTSRSTPSGRLVVSASVPVTPDLLDTLAEELGPIQFDVLRPGDSGQGQAVPVVINRQRYTRVQEIATRGRTVPRAANPFDKLITGLVSLDVVDQNRMPAEGQPARVFAAFSTRPSLLNRRLFGRLGELGSAAVTALLVVGSVFLVIEFGSLVTGVVLTRTMTTAVDDLYQATQHVQEGDLTFRVRVRHQDQLGALGNSFNSMIQSVSMLIEEQRKRQQLENELSIANQVQSQLFPRKLPQMPGVELEAICRPARMVSGDYYDFIRIDADRLAIAVADISGKGISAALLMANVQAALRSDVLRHRAPPEAKPAAISTAEIISHLNRHLYRNTSDERYATFFFAVYDAGKRRLVYTNGGHLPPLYISGSRVERLETGGMVVGLFDDVPFEQGIVEIDPGGLLIAYSDGLIEPENVYGEEFGTERLIEIAMRHRQDSPHVIAEAMMRAAEEWSATPELSDDMTVIVARFSPGTQEART